MVRIQWSLPCFHCDMIMIKYMNIHMKVSSNGGISRSYQETNDFGYPLNVKNHPYGHIQYTSIYIILSNDPFANLMFFFQVRHVLCYLHFRFFVLPSSTQEALIKSFEEFQNWSVGPVRQCIHAPWRQTAAWLSRCFFGSFFLYSFWSF